MRKSYEEITAEIMRRKKEYYKKQRKITNTLLVVIPCFCMVIIGFLFHNFSFVKTNNFSQSFTEFRVEALFAGGYGAIESNENNEVSRVEEFVTTLFNSGGHDNELTYLQDNKTDYFLSEFENVDYVLFFKGVDDKQICYVITRYYIIKNNKELIEINLEDYLNFQKMINEIYENKQK